MDTAATGSGDANLEKLQQKMKMVLEKTMDTLEKPLVEALEGLERSLIAAEAPLPDRVVAPPAKAAQAIALQRIAAEAKSLARMAAALEQHLDKIRIVPPEMGALDMDEFMTGQSNHSVKAVASPRDQVPSTAPVDVDRSAEKKEPAAAQVYQSQYTQNVAVDAPWGSETLESRQQAEALLREKRAGRVVADAETNPDTDSTLLIGKKTVGVGKERISMDIQLDCSKFWIGSTIPVRLDIENSSSKRVVAITTRLLKRTSKFRVVPGEDIVKMEEWDRLEEFIDEVEHTPTGFPVEPRKHFKGILKLKLPFEMLESTPDNVTTEETISYFLHFRVKMAGRIGPEVKIGPAAMFDRFKAIKR